MKWTEGRQGSGYFKRLLGCGQFLSIPWDLYLIKFPEGSFINTHTDPVQPGDEHYRLNIVVKGAEGGKFHGRTLYETKRVKLFRPDIEPHWVSEVEKGTRYVLSFGFLLKK